jgi:phospholipid/cholesterol/gamma-HCH transport system permease protein
VCFHSADVETKLVNAVTRPLVSFLSVLGSMGSFMGQIMVALVTPPTYWGETLRAMRNVALQTLIPVVAIMTAVGMIGALQGLAVIRIFGADHVLSSLLAESVLREMSPTLASIMIAAQAGTAIAGEIGTMRVKEEVDALGVMAVNPIKYVVVPRMIALATMCPILNILASAAGMLGGFVVAVYLKGVTMGTFVANLMSFVDMNVIYTGMIKSTLFGVLIGLIACYYGYHVTGGAQGVGKASWPKWARWASSGGGSSAGCSPTCPKAARYSIR